MDTFFSIAKDLKGEILFVYSGIQGTELEDNLNKYIGLTDADLPCIFILYTEGEGRSLSKIKWDGDISTMSTEVMKNYISEFKSGNLKPYLMSQPIPEEIHTPGLTIIVGKTWE